MREQLVTGELFVIAVYCCDALFVCSRAEMQISFGIAVACVSRTVCEKSNRPFATVAVAFCRAEVLSYLQSIVNMGKPWVPLLY